MKFSKSHWLWIAAWSCILAAVGMAQRRTIPESHSPLLYPLAYDGCLRFHKPVVTRRDIYHEGWIDLNKNGRKNIYEDSTRPEEHRLDGLIQMTLDEKTVQLVTL